MKRKIARALPTRSQQIRFWIQIAFALLCLWIGVEFILFVRFYEGTSTLFVARPPGVEGFLPISALMSVWLWVSSGTLSTIHPAGTFILIAIIAVSLVFKKSFCSWFCPVGLLSENIGALGKKLFGRAFIPPRWLDYPLRSLKYLMLGFLISVLADMTSRDLFQFLDSPYNRVADVKMLYFFEQLSSTTGIVLALLAVASVFITNFWCRYLCPYGALLGITSLLSPFRITRSKESCIDCAKCTKVCPAAIKVDRLSVVMSDECTSCLACVDACPVAATLEMKTSKRGLVAKPWMVGATIVLLFMLITGVAMLFGYWKSSIGDAEYSSRIKDIHNPIYHHNMGQAPGHDASDTSQRKVTDDPPTE